MRSFFPAVSHFVSQTHQEHHRGRRHRLRGRVHGRFGFLRARVGRMKFSGKLPTAGGNFNVQEKMKKIKTRLQHRGKLKESLVKTASEFRQQL